jgi:hypothetical protein
MPASLAENNLKDCARGFDRPIGGSGDISKEYVEERSI